MIVSPSILSANFNFLLTEIAKVNNAEYLHIDVMDGHFVPNISFGTIAYKNLRSYTEQIFDVHLMIDNPLFYAEIFSKSGADIITFHLESKDYPFEVIKKIKSLGKKVGISIKPKTDVKELLPYLELVDMVLVMSVEPGFGGQKFMPMALDKIAYLAEYRKEKGLKYLIEVDGGINQETAEQCAKVNVDIVVAGTYVFKAENPRQVVAELQAIKWDIL